MRIWDINPGYLNRQSLLGEHRELHGIVSIIVNGKKGYSRHPETLRWIDYGWALNHRHNELSNEMALRGYTDKTPVTTKSNYGIWPLTFIDAPHEQFKLLKKKYLGKEMGRIPLPKNEQELWSHHKYSVLARDPSTYQQIGHSVSNKEIRFSELALTLIQILRTRPSDGGVRNAIQHMWGHVRAKNEQNNSAIETWPLTTLLNTIQKNAMATNEPYLTKSTALSELMTWL